MGRMMVAGQAFFFFFSHSPSPIPEWCSRRIDQSAGDNGSVSQGAPGCFPKGCGKTVVNWYPRLSKAGPRRALPVGRPRPVHRLSFRFLGGLFGGGAARGGSELAWNLGQSPPNPWHSRDHLPNSVSSVLPRQWTLLVPDFQRRARCRVWGRKRLHTSYQADLMPIPS